jgi:hypothetical protein
MSTSDQDLARRAVARSSVNLNDELVLLDELGLLESADEHCEDDACEHIFSPPNQ